MFVALEIATQVRTEADVADKRSSYACSKCNEKVILAQGKKVRWHFKHGRGSECSYSKGETWQHEAAKSVILMDVRSRGLRAEPEFEVLSIEGDRRADVVIWAPNSDPSKDSDLLRRAFEVQYSAIETESLRCRTQAYMTAGVPVIWMPVVDEQRFTGDAKSPRPIEHVLGTNLFRVYGYSVPFWIDDIESLLGHIWIFVPQTGAFWKGWLLTHFLYRNPSDGYDSDGNQYSSGGYWYSAKKLRDLYLEGPYSFGSLGIVCVNQSANKFLSPTKEARFMLDLIPPDGEKGTTRPIEKRRRTHENGFEDYADWVRIGDDWELAQFELMGKMPFPIQSNCLGPHISPLPSRERIWRLMSVAN